MLSKKMLKNSSLFHEFFKSEKAGGLILVFVTIISIWIANSSWQVNYIHFFQTIIGGHSMVHWINDGLMTLFFLLIGLELEREIYQGELSTLKKASMPIIAALGGMLVPAGIYFLLNTGTDKLNGTGIPMATDIAFAIGVLSLLGNRVPLSLKIFLTAFAVIDDLGAIIVIALFYTKTIVLSNLFIGLGIFAVLLLLNRLKVLNLIPYVIGGIAMWYFILNSGIHATIAGVLLAFAIPFGNGNNKSPSYIMQHLLHKPVAFLILPLFALANTCIVFGDQWLDGLTNSSSLGIMLGLVVGKPLGIWIFSFLGVALGICTLPSSLHWKSILGAGCLGGIGFTMSIFISLLAFESEAMVNSSKMAILFASIFAGVIGFLFLNWSLKERISNKIKLVSKH